VVIEMEPKELTRVIIRPAHHTLSVLVENKFGVLARVTTLISRRGYNIFSLAVAPTDDPKISRITIVVDADSTPMDQIVKQLNKLINVLEIRELTPDESVERELLLMTVSADATRRAEIAELVNIFDAKIVNVGLNAVTVMLSDPPDKLDDFEDLMRPYGIVELQRSGRVALPKLARSETRLHSVPTAG
jgi:acetolactate synthase I/III small subunit